MNIFIDLDGTLLDISSKYYLAHMIAAKKFNIKALSFKRYWILKRKKITENEIMKIDVNSNKYKLYEKERKKLLEDEDVLTQDVLFPGVPQLLKNLKKKNKLYLITLRNEKNALKNQLIRLNIKSYFNQVLSYPPGKKPVETKISMIRNIGFHLEDMIIGDTEADIAAGKKLGIRTIAVASGIRTSHYLKQFKPDLLIKSILKLSVTGYHVR